MGFPSFALTWEAEEGQSWGCGAAEHAAVLLWFYAALGLCRG